MEGCRTDGTSPWGPLLNLGLPLRGLPLSAPGLVEGGLEPSELWFSSCPLSPGSAIVLWGMQFGGGGVGQPLPWRDLLDGETSVSKVWGPAWTVGVHLGPQPEQRGPALPCDALIGSLHDSSPGSCAGPLASGPPRCLGGSFCGSAF